VFDSPVPLPKNAVIDGFTPDSSAQWVVAYAGPCGDPECNLQHARIYLVPMVGWINAAVPATEGDAEIFLLRPAVMTTNGVIADYLDVPATYRLIGVLRSSDEVIKLARDLYEHKFGDKIPLINEVSTQAN
jgi:hypothetical protein